MTKARMFVCIAVAMLGIMTGCQKAPSNQSTVTPSQASKQPTTGITILPTFTPTPWATKPPVELDLSGEGMQFLPRLSGTMEPVWEMYDWIPMETVVKGSGDMKAEFRVMWSVDTIYVQVHVINDKTIDVSANNYLSKDSVVFYLNENGEKNKVYGVGDSFCAVDRSGHCYFGTGCDENRTRLVAYEELDEEGKSIGYYAEAAIPLLTLRVEPGTVIGFDVRVNNASKGRLRHSLAWSDKSGHADVNLRGVGLLTLE